MYGNVAVVGCRSGRGGGLNDFEEHGAFVLVEPFRGSVDVIVCASIGATDDHDCYILVVDAVVVYGRFEEVGICFEPGEG